MDWENEVVPDEKKHCKKKLLRLVKYLSNFEIPFDNAKPKSNEYTETFVSRERGDKDERGYIMVELDIDGIGTFDEDTVWVLQRQVSMLASIVCTCVLVLQLDYQNLNFLICSSDYIF